MDSQRFFTGFGLLSVSLAMHGSVFFTMDHAASIYQIHIAQEQRRLQREKDGPIQFEFVEASPKAHPRKPARTKKISNRDALNQDLLKDKSGAVGLPRTEFEGKSDQLAQRQGSFSQTPVPRIAPKPVAPEEKQAPMPKGEADHARNDVIRNSQPPQPPMKPKAEIKGAAGVDKITTQEMSKIKSPGARLFGQTSFEATGSGMGEYMKNLKERIWLAWFPYLAYQYPQDFRGADAIVSFTLDPKGQVKIVQLVDSVGSPVFASYCMEAVQRASGFGPVPREILALIGKDELEIKFGFHYR